jgi:hypothetical protein
MQSTKKPYIPMCDFFALPAIVALIEIQKANPWGSEAHKKAFADAKALAEVYGAGKLFGDY